MMRGALPLIRIPKSAFRNRITEANSVVQRFPTLLLALALVLVPVFAQQPAPPASPQSAQQQLFGHRNAPQPTPTNMYPSWETVE